MVDDDDVRVNVGCMRQISKIILARDASCKLSLDQLVFSLTEKFLEYSELSKDYHESSEPQKEDIATELDETFLKINLSISVLVKYFYPIIEQLEKLADDGIKSDKEFR
jgi:hypothetical protein